ncbi:MAG: family 16 glycosylhydrolase [Verrucomicrobiota bacterium]
MDSLNQFGGAYNQSANTLDLYFNGKVVAFRVLGSGIIRPYNGKMVIGKGMAGFISQAQIYSYIPSENQISNLGSLDIIAKLPFENGVVDQTGNLTMTAEGAPTFVSDTMGTCVSFNGVAQAASSNAYLQSKNSFSVTCFAKSPTIAWSASSAFVSKENVFYLGTLQGSKKICFSVQSTSGQWTTLFYEPTHDISLWHHYAGTYDVDAKMLSLIYDGKIVSTTPFTGTLNTGSTAVSVGRLSTSSLACQMDDVVIFAYARTNYDYIDVASLNNRVDLVAEGINPQDYKLTFRDEFNGTELDQTKWRFPFTLYRGNTMDPQDTVVGNGTMKLNARYQDGTLYGSYIQTRDLFQQKYGYYEARIKTHKNQGIHSCFWIQSPTYGQIKDDLVFSGAEVDIMEFFGTGRSDGGLAQNIYYNSGADLTGTAVKILATNSGATVDRTISPSTQFHVYGVEWSPAGYQFYVDGKKSIFVASGISGRDEYLILSLYSSDWERPRLNTAALPDNIEVDYVRAFIKK